MKAEEALQQQHTLAAALLDVANSLLVVLDAEGMIVEVNRACRQTTGFDLDRILGKSFVSVFVPPEDLDLVSGMFRHAIRNQAACQFESTLLTKNGVRLHVDWSLRVTCNIEGAAGRGSQRRAAHGAGPPAVHNSPH